MAPGLLGAIVLISAALLWLDAGRWLQPQALTEELRGAGILGPLMIMGLMILAVIIGPIPTVPITVTAGAVFGPWLGFTYAMTSALLGALLAFWIARFAAHDLVRRVIGGHALACARCSDSTLFWLVLGARLVPVVSFAAVSYGAGLTAMSTRAFLLATAIGMVPMTALFVVAGTTLTIDPYWAAFGGVLLVVLLLGIPGLIERFRPDIIEAMHTNGDHRKKLSD